MSRWVFDLYCMADYSNGNYFLVKNKTKEVHDCTNQDYTILQQELCELPWVVLWSIDRDTGVGLSRNLLAVAWRAPVSCQSSLILWEFFEALSVDILEPKISSFHCLTEPGGRNMNHNFVWGGDRVSGSSVIATHPWVSLFGYLTSPRIWFLPTNLRSHKIKNGVIFLQRRTFDFPGF